VSIHDDQIAHVMLAHAPRSLTDWLGLGRGDDLAVAEVPYDHFGPFVGAPSPVILPITV
jgi:hypothetical protein